jgi:hypothetical protein
MWRGVNNSPIIGRLVLDRREQTRVVAGRDGLGYGPKQCRSADGGGYRRRGRHSRNSGRASLQLHITLLDSGQQLVSSLAGMSIEAAVLDVDTACGSSEDVLVTVRELRKRDADLVLVV